MLKKHFYLPRVETKMDKKAQNSEYKRRRVGEVKECNYV